MRITLCFLLLFVSNAVFSQKSTALSDKEYLRLQDKFKLSLTSNVDSAFIYVDKIENSGNPAHKAFALVSKAYLFQLGSKMEESKKAYAKAFEYLDIVPVSAEKTKLNAYMLNISGSISWKKKNYSEALAQFQKGKRLSQSIHDEAQILKFNINIALINGEVGNFKSAITVLKESGRIIDKTKNLYTDDELVNIKGNLYSYLGAFYEKEYFSNKAKYQFLDSAEYFHKKTILYSKDFNDRKMLAQMNLGNIYYEKKEYTKAEKTYYDLLLLTKENGNTSIYYNVNFNLGRLYFYTKKYNNALTCFQKVDSIYNATKTGESEFGDANYYQAKIYDSYKNAQKAYDHSNIYLKALEKSQSKYNNEAMEVNYAMGTENLRKEISAIQKKYKNAIFLKNTLMGFVAVLFAVLLFVLFRNVKKRKGIEEKISLLIAEHKANLENRNKEQEEVIVLVNTFSEDKGTQLSIDEEKENEIVRKLINLEKKLQYLTPDFTQQSVAKKIKTNTTYLSYVVNKRFGKTFSEYVNELKINYVINEMISNPTFRKYSTQAMAESVGYKNAVSFTKTFSKRTGITPVQFIRKVENEETALSKIIKE